MPSALRRRELHVVALIDHLARGGAELLLAQFASASAHVGIRLSVACLKEIRGNPAADSLRAVGIEPVTLHIRERLGARSYRGVRRYLATARPDLVHTHLGAADVLGCYAARSLGVPAVSTIHSMEWGRGSVRARAGLAVMAHARRTGASRVVAVSESAREAYLARGWDVPERVVTVHNGIDVSAARGAGAAVRHELGLAPDDFLLGMVSALRPEKAHDVAIAAVRRLRDTFPGVRLLVVGDGTARHDVERLAAPLGDAVVLAGARTDVMRVFDAIDLCVHPSRADAFPTTLLEAMAASVPVVATAVGGIPEIVDDGVTGILVPVPPSPERVADEIAALIRDAERRRALADSGRARYEELFTAAPWAERTRAVYDAVLAEAEGNGGGA